MKHDFVILPHCYYLMGELIEYKDFLLLLSERCMFCFSNAVLIGGCRRSIPCVALLSSS